MVRGRSIGGERRRTATVDLSDPNLRIRRIAHFRHKERSSSALANVFCALNLDGRTDGRTDGGRRSEWRRAEPLQPASASEPRRAPRTPTASFSGGGGERERERERERETPKGPPDATRPPDQRVQSVVRSCALSFSLSLSGELQCIIPSVHRKGKKQARRRRRRRKRASTSSEDEEEERPSQQFDPATPLHTYVKTVHVHVQNGMDGLHVPHGQCRVPSSEARSPCEGVLFRGRWVVVGEWTASREAALQIYELCTPFCVSWPV